MALFVVFFFLLSGTRTGRHIYAIGSNVDAAKLSGVSVLATTTKAYLVSAFCSCVVGLILCGRVADPGERPEHDRRPGGHPAAGYRHHRGGSRVPGRGDPQRRPEKTR